MVRPKEDVYWGAMLTAPEMIESGVTTVADHYFAMDSVAEAIATSKKLIRQAR